MSNEKQQQHFPERDHGFGRTPFEPIAAPVAKLLKTETAACPNCGCKDLCDINVLVRAVSILRVDEGCEAFTAYIGCPACPWASPAITSTRLKTS